ncbi:15231_t:CDS:2, partial [Funneliformis geosporum]
PALGQISQYTGQYTPDEYIQKVGFADNQVLPALYTHLPPDLRSNIKMYMAIRAGGGVNPTVDDFFQNLKKCWVERQVRVSTFTQTNI